MCIRDRRHIKKDSLGNKIWFPEHTRQTALANFLDYETGRIDKLIESKARQVELIEQKVSSEILNLLTKGMSDRHEIIEDSEFEWIKWRPKNWVPIKLKWFFRENTNYSEDGTETLLSLRMLQGLVPHNDVSDKPIPPDALIGYKRVFKGQVVMNRMRAAIGLFGVADRDGIVSPDYSIFDVSDDAFAPFFLRLFKTQPMMSAFRLLSKGLGNGSQGFMRLNANRFGSIKVAVPNFDEQVEISKLIEDEIKRTDALKANILKSISLLQEKRAALISAAVTGELNIDHDSISFAPANDNISLLVAYEVIRANQSTPRFGRVKFQKLIYLAETHIGFTEIQGSYEREAAGPLDRALLNRLEAGLEAQNLFLSLIHI